VSFGDERPLLSPGDQAQRRETTMATDRLNYSGAPDGSDGIIHIAVNDTGSGNRVMVFSQQDANSPHHKFEWLLEVQPDHSVVLMRVERNAGGQPLQWLGVCRFKWDGHVQLGPFQVT
jgi:hypothetical protein